MQNWVNDFLDKYILPWPVRFLTFRFVILATMALLIPLILFADNTVLVLALNSYLNTMSVAVSSIVLLYATISQVHQKQIADMQEKRAEEDHLHVTEMHAAILQAAAAQHEELEDVKEILAAMRGETYTRQPSPAQPNLRDLHPRGKVRFQPGDRKQRLAQAGIHVEPKHR